MGNTSRSRVSIVWVALGGFTALTIAVFRPTLHDLAHTVPAFGGRAGDVLLLMWAMGHVSSTLFADPLHLFDGRILYPARDTLAYGDHMIGQALVGLPVWLTTHNLPLEYNLLLLASYALGATTMFAYAREQLGDDVAAVAAGVVFAFTPFRFHSPLWLQVLFTPFMPLALLFWMRFVRGLAWSDWCLWVVAWVLHSLMGMYLTLHFAVTMGALGLYALVAAPTRRSWRLWAGTLLAPVTALLFLFPTFWPYLRLRQIQGHLRTGGLDTHLNFVLPGPGTLSGWVAGLEGPAQFGPGLLVVALVLLGIIVAGRRARGSDFGRFARGVHVLGLGVTLLLVLTPIRFQLLIPGFDMLRATNRAFFVSLLFVGIFVGEAVAWLKARVASPRAAATIGAALVVALLADMATPPRERLPVPVGKEIPAVYEWVRRLPPDAVLYEHVTGIEAPTFAMYYSIVHGKRIANGYSGFVSSGTTYLAHRLYGFPAEEALALLDELGIRWVLEHFRSPEERDRLLERLRAGPVEAAATFGTDVVFSVPARGRVGPATAGPPLDRTGWQLSASDVSGQLGALRDGDPRTAWSIASDGRRGAPWIQIDLGTLTRVVGVRCIPLRPDDPDPLGIHLAQVELSPDAQHWSRTNARFRPDSLVTLLNRPAELRYYEARFSAQEARYVRLVNPEVAFWSGVWQIAELEVLGSVLPGAGDPRPSEDRGQPTAPPA